VLNQFKDEVYIEVEDNFDDTFDHQTECTSNKIDNVDVVVQK
jgi:hypothetical protein